MKVNVQNFITFFSATFAPVERLFSMAGKFFWPVLQAYRHSC